MDTLIYTHIFPYPFVPNVQKDTSTYITMKFKYNQSSSNVFKVGAITFYVFCHKSIVRTSYNALRYDYILERLDEVVNDTRGETWLGKLSFYSMEDMVISSPPSYVGASVTYRNVEFT